MYHNAIIWQIVPPNTNRWKQSAYRAIGEGIKDSSGDVRHSFAD